MSDYKSKLDKNLNIYLEQENKSQQIVGALITKLTFGNVSTVYV